MFDTALTPPTADQDTVDHYVAKGRRLRARAFADMVHAIFSAPEAATGTSTAKADCTA